MKRRKKSYIVWGVVGALIAVVVAVCAGRWRVWFRQPAEEPYTVACEPTRVLLTFGNDGEMSRNVSWMCDTVVRPSRLTLVRCFADSLGLPPDTYAVDTIEIEARGETFRSRAGLAAYYTARLDSLDADATYCYRVTTGDASSDWFGFTTKKPSSGRVAMVYVGDVQDTIHGMARQYLRRAFERYPDAEMLVSAGDFTDRPRDADWQVTFDMLGGLAPRVPLLVVAGNHDYLKGIVGRLERRFALVYSYFQQSELGNIAVYNLRYGPAEFFLLDSTREFPLLHVQRKWLKRKLAESDARWKIVVTHHPLYSIKSAGSNIVQRWMFADVIEDGGVDLVLQGHEHNYARRSTDGHAPYYVISHCSPKNYRHTDGSGFDVADFDGRYYQYISIDGDTLTMVARRADNDSFVDSLVIVK